MTYIISLTLLILFWLFFFIFDRKMAKIIVADIRLTRMLHYILAILFGVAFAGNRGTIFVNGETYYLFIFSCASLVFAIIFSIITNNIEDIEIDKISNPERPLPMGLIDIKTYKKYAILFLVLTLIFSYICGMLIFILINAFTLIYYVYSMPPLKIKRVPFFSKFCISLNTLLMSLAGFSIVNCEITAFPLKYVMFYLILLTPAINFIDIKDYEGDKKNGIKTLPVVMGLRASKILTGLFFIIAYSVASIEFAPAAIGGIILFFLITRKNYREDYVFYVYLTGLTILLINYFMQCKDIIFFQLHSVEPFLFVD